MNAPLKIFLIYFITSVAIGCASTKGDNSNATIASDILGGITSAVAISNDATDTDSIIEDGTNSPEPDSLTVARDANCPGPGCPSNKDATVSSTVTISPPASVR